MPKVACTSCAVEVEVAEEALGLSHTCENCGTEFELKLQPDDADVSRVTISLGEAFKQPPAPQTSGGGSFLGNLFGKFFGGK